jgi:hypothetical protein
MSQIPSNSSNPPGLFPPPRGRFDPGQAACVIASYIRAMILIVLWAVAGTAALAAGFVAVRAIWFAVSKAVAALGI